MRCRIPQRGLEVICVTMLVGFHCTVLMVYARYFKVILEDLKLLEIKPDRWSHSSDYFDVILEYCERLLKEGKAYVDETDAETMRKEREERKESKYRNSCMFCFLSALHFTHFAMFLTSYLFFVIPVFCISISGCLKFPEFPVLLPFTSCFILNNK